MIVTFAPAARSDRILRVATIPPPMTTTDWPARSRKRGYRIEIGGGARCLAPRLRSSWKGCKPDSVFDSHLSMRPVPAAWRCGPHPRRLFGLAPDGVCRAPVIAAGVVSFYLAVSPLPRHECRGGLFSVALSVRRRLRQRPRLAPGIAPCGVWTFLHPNPACAGWDSDYPPFQIVIQRPCRARVGARLTPPASIERVRSTRNW